MEQRTDPRSTPDKGEGPRLTPGASLRGMVGICQINTCNLWEGGPGGLAARYEYEKVFVLVNHLINLLLVYGRIVTKMCLDHKKSINSIKMQKRKDRKGEESMNPAEFSRDKEGPRG